MGLLTFPMQYFKTQLAVHLFHTELPGSPHNFMLTYLEEVAGERLTHDHVVADVTESGLLEDVLLKGVGLAAAWVQASPGGRGRQASWGGEGAGAGADLSQHVPWQLRVAAGSLEEVVGTFAP